MRCQLDITQMILQLCTLVLTISHVRANVTPKSHFETRLKGLHKEEKEEVLKLEIYDAGTHQVKDLGHWFCMISGLENPTNAEAYDKLKAESCNETLHSRKEMVQGLISMCDSFNEAHMSVTNCPSKLLRTECMVIYMYSSEFYTTYNPNLRNGHWQPYKVFTSLLYTGLSKLDQLHPLPNNTVLYRGMDKKFDIDSKGRFYFKQFVSTTLDEEVAELFGTGTVIVITPDVPILAAKLLELSKYPGEEEVLISPFEAFELVNKTGNRLFFKSSKSQDFLENQNLQCSDEPSKSETKKPGVKFTFTLEGNSADKLMPKVYQLPKAFIPILIASWL